MDKSSAGANNAFVMPLYYLETNALIGLRKYMNTPAVDWSRCYTSQLAFMELMKGTNERSYSAKREILVEIQAAGIRIDWEAPIDKVVRSFGLEWEDPEGGHLARLLHQSVLKAATIEECKQILAEHGEESLLDVPEFNLGVFSALQTSAVEKAVRDPNRLTRRQGRAFRKFLSNRLEGVDTSKIKAVTEVMSKEAALLAIASGLLLRLEMPAGEDAVSEMLGRYNGTLDTYLSAMNEYFATKVFEKETPAPNDAVDLSHFLYLATPSCRIVSDDKRVLTLAASINQRKGLTLLDFRGKMHL